MEKSWDIDADEFVNKNIKRTDIYNTRRESIPKIYNSICVKFNKSKKKVVRVEATQIVDNIKTQFQVSFNTPGLKSVKVQKN